MVTASGKHKEKLKPEDFVVIDGEGRPTVAGQPKSSAETLLHCVIARRMPHIGAILHTHSVSATLLSHRFLEQGAVPIAGFEMLKGLSGITTHETAIEVPIFENTQDIPVLAAQVESRIDAADTSLNHGYLIHRHGLYTWGEDLDAARRQIEIFEFLFECVARGE